MRNAFATALQELAETDERVILLTGDLGFTVFERFAEQFPERFFNAGVAEQNMIGMATGLAEGGFVPFAYSIATFASMRPYEFIRNGPVLHDLPVRIVGVGGGLDYGHNGVTHYALEDVALMRAQPGMTIVVPADPDQARAAIALTKDHGGPIYFRIGRQNSPIEGLDGRFALGSASFIGEGRDLAIVALGPSAAEAVAAARLLEDAEIDCTIAVISSFTAEPDPALGELLSRVPTVLTVEAHYAVGGVGSYVSELVAEAGAGCRVVRCAVSRMPRGQTGSRELLFDLHGISPAAVAEVALEALRVEVG